MEKRVAGRIRRSRVIVLIGRIVRSQLHKVIVVMVAVGMGMDVPGRHARRNHRQQQQQPCHLPDGALDPEAHAAVEGSD